MTVHDNAELSKRVAKLQEQMEALLKDFLKLEASIAPKNAPQGTKVHPVKVIPVKKGRSR